LKKVLYSLIIVYLLLFSGCTQITQNTQSWPFDKMVSFNGNHYVGSEDAVNVVGEKLGSVKYYSTNEVDDNKDCFSNHYKVGTNFYAIPNISNKDTIAIEISQGKYVKADNINIVLNRTSNNSKS
jgi:hypothetical protein